MIAKGGSLVKPGIVEAAKIPSLDHFKPLEAAYKQQAVLRAALVSLMEKYQLDAIVYPHRTALPDKLATTPNRGGDRSESRNQLHSYTGLPTIIVPGGFFPSDGMPFAVQFLGKPFDEATLIKVSSGYEAVSKHRKAPTSTPPLPGEKFQYKAPDNNT